MSNIDLQSAEFRAEFSELALKVVTQVATPEEKLRFKALKAEISQIVKNDNTPEAVIAKLEKQIAVLQSKIDAILESGEVPAKKTRKPRAKKVVAE